MDPLSADITSLMEFYSVDQIRGFWKQAFEAKASRATQVVIVTNTGFEGQTSSGINLASPEEIAAFITACQAAIKKIQGDTSTSPENLGTPVSFAGRILTV